MGQLGIRLLVLVINIVVNIGFLTSQASFFGMNYIPFIVLFNAILIFVIYAVDFFIVEERKYRVRLRLGERVLKGEVHSE